MVNDLAETSGNEMAGVNFRMFDGISYWDPSTRTDCNKKQITVDLTQPIDKWKNDTETEGTLDITNIGIIGFWSFGNESFTINKMYLTNVAPDEDVKEDEEPPTADGNTEVVLPGMEDTEDSAF